MSRNDGSGVCDRHEEGTSVCDSRAFTSCLRTFDAISHADRDLLLGCFVLPASAHSCPRDRCCIPCFRISETFVTFLEPSPGRHTSYCAALI